MKCIWIFTDTYLPIIDGVSIALKNQISILGLKAIINSIGNARENSIVISIK